MGEGIRVRRLVVVAIVALVVTLVPAAAAQELVWSQPVGLLGASVATGAGDVFVSGSVDTGHGVEAVVVALSGSGTELWRSQFAPTPAFVQRYVRAFGIAAGSNATYAVGETDGALAGQVSAGGSDAFVRRYDVSGTQTWTRQFGTTENDSATAVAVDATGVYVAGSTLGSFAGAGSGFHAFVRKYDHAGTHLWTWQSARTLSDNALDVAAVNGSAYVVGGRLAPNGAFDGLVIALAGDGTERWSNVIETVYEDTALGVAADSTGIYVGGYTGGVLEGQTTSGDIDALILRYTSAGDILWTRQFGTNTPDAVTGLTADAFGVYASGYTYGTLGAASSGGLDSYVRRIDAFGTPVSTTQFSPGPSSGIAADDANVYVSAGDVSTIFAFEKLASPTIKNLIAAVRSLSLARGIEQSLVSKLERADAAFERGGASKSSACDLLKAFVNELGALEAAGTLTSSTAGPLRGTAASIATAAGCS